MKGTSLITDLRIDCQDGVGMPGTAQAVETHWCITPSARAVAKNDPANAGNPADAGAESAVLSDSGGVVQTLTTGGACDFWYLYDANGNVGQLLRYDAAGFGEAFDKVWDLPSSPADVVRKVVGWVMPNADNTNVFGKLEKAALKSIYSSIPQCCELEFNDLRIASLSAGMLYLPPFPSIDEFTASSPPTVPNR